MSDKERLEEVVENVVFLRGLTGSLNAELPEDDFWYLYEQAERVQELEEEIEDWRKEVKKWQMFFRKESQQNKRYREVIKRALDESGWGDEGNALHRTISILAKALEGDDD